MATHGSVLIHWNQFEMGGRRLLVSNVQGKKVGLSCTICIRLHRSLVVRLATERTIQSEQWCVVCNEGEIPYLLVLQSAKDRVSEWTAQYKAVSMTKGANEAADTVKVPVGCSSNA